MKPNYLKPNHEVKFLIVFLSLFLFFAALETISKSSCRFSLENLAIGRCRVSDIGVDCILRSCMKLKSLTISLEKWSWPKISEETLNQWKVMYPQIHFEIFVLPY